MYIRTLEMFSRVGKYFSRSREMACYITAWNSPLVSACVVVAGGSGGGENLYSYLEKFLHIRQVVLQVAGNSMQQHGIR